MAKAQVTTYDAKNCAVSVKGVVITGLSDDFITGSKDEDYFSTSVGAQGDVITNAINNDLGTVKIKVQSTSPQIKHLKSLQTVKTPFPVWCSNKKLHERFGGSKALLQSAPEVSRGAECDDLEFTFQVFDYSNTYLK